MTSSAIRTISGSVIRNAIVDLRCQALRKAERRPALPASDGDSNAASTIPDLTATHDTCRRPFRRAANRSAASSGSHEAFDLALGPGERLLQRLALHEAHHHLGLDRLGIDLHGDLRRRRLS